MSGVRRIPELDGLRAVAILLVIGCHYPAFSTKLWRLPQFGWIGVDLFFALSGYLITSILLGMRGKPKPYRTFYARRFIRILPPYLIVTFLLLPGIACEHQSIGRYLLSQALFLQGFFANQSWADVLQRIMHPLGAFAIGRHLNVAPTASPTYAGAAGTFWSLSVEEYFYLLWAPVVLHFSRRTIARIAASVCAVELCLRFLLGRNILTYMSTPLRFDALMFGALLALFLAESREALIPTLAASLAALSVILFCLRPILGHELRESVLFLGVGLTLLGIISAALVGLLVTHSGTLGWIGAVLRSRPFVFLGTISYTLYLVHTGIMVAILHVPASPMIQAILAAILSIGVAYASWHFVERPCLEWKDGRFPNAPHPKEPALV